MWILHGWKFVYLLSPGRYLERCSVRDSNTQQTNHVYMLRNVYSTQTYIQNTRMLYTFILNYPGLLPFQNNKDLIT